MANMFITLHDRSDDSPFRVNVDHLVMYEDHLIFASCNTLKGRYPVKETMQEITSQLSMLHVQIALG